MCLFRKSKNQKANIEELERRNNELTAELTRTREALKNMAQRAEDFENLLLKIKGHADSVSPKCNVTAFKKIKELLTDFTGD